MEEFWMRKVSIISEVNRDAFYILAKNTSYMATDEKTLHVPIKGLKAGCWLEYAVTRRAKGIRSEIPFIEKYFVSRGFERFVAVSFNGDTHLLKTKQSGLPEPTEVDGGCYWIVNPVQKFVWERYLPEYASFLPYLMFVDARSTWDEIVRNYLSDNRGCA